MKTQAMASALRLTLSPSEAAQIGAVIDAGIEALGHKCPDKAHDISAAIALCLAEVRENKARRDRVRRAAMPAPTRPMVNMDIGEFFISAELGDWVDIAVDPSYSVWGDLAMHPDRQGEVRRNVWRVRVLKRDYDGLKPCACELTETAAKTQIEALGHVLIEGLA